MFLALQDVAGLFHNSKGIQDDMWFHTVTDHAQTVQPKGLFIPMNEGSGELLDAIANGAIAAIWEQERELPRYTPSQFPIFFTNDLADAMRELIMLYSKKIDGDTNKQMEITNFKLTNKMLLNKNKQTYDIAVIIDKLMNNKERRG
ncbi:hypothetical protein [Neobacillus jeddahensis]|uniref:hypothetical protein n=1 Tax=Neobacillus jeddahensis TaxID=1461580 RepID=UPI00058B072F|nr:hypothetical protein [Neobacillus jeddahensis]